MSYFKLPLSSNLTQKNTIPRFCHQTLQSCSKKSKSSIKTQNHQLIRNTSKPVQRREPCPKKPKIITKASSLQPDCPNHPKYKFRTNRQNPKKKPQPSPSKPYFVSLVLDSNSFGKFNFLIHLTPLLFPRMGTHTPREYTLSTITHFNLLRLSKWSN